VALIYALCFPTVDDCDVRYIGYTLKSIEIRLKEHLKEKSNTHKVHWLASIKPNIPLVRTLEECRPQIVKEREKYWIAKYKSLGRLTNATGGGDGLFQPSELTRRKISDAHKKITGWHHSEETKKKISDARNKSNFHLRHTPDAKAKMSAIHKGHIPYIMTPEIIEKIRLARTGKSGCKGEKNGTSKLTDNKVIEIRKMYKTGLYSTYKLGRIYGVSQSQISNIVLHKQWKHIPD
jgi:hypothetical protein